MIYYIAFINDPVLSLIAFAKDKRPDGSFSLLRAAAFIIVKRRRKGDSMIEYELTRTSTLLGWLLREEFGRLIRC